MWRLNPNASMCFALDKLTVSGAMQHVVHMADQVSSPCNYYSLACQLKARSLDLQLAGLPRPSSCELRGITVFACW